MARRPSSWMTWAVVVVLVYAGLVAVAYSIGPVTPAPSSCLTVGKGDGRTENGDLSDFGILDLGGPSAKLVFTDSGPAAPLQLRNVHISKIACNGSATHATVIGTARLAGQSAMAFGFRVDLGMSAIQRGIGTSASVRFRLANGYDSGTESLTAANFTIDNHGVKRQAIVTTSGGR